MASNIIMEKDINNYNYKLYKTANVEHNIIIDFLSVHNIVFPMAMEEELFNRKYIRNIYGDSFFVIVYFNGHPVSIDAMWRNDINSRVAYQSCDTATLENHRGKGIFKIVTNMFLEVIGNEDIIYKYPNIRSYPGYMKMGWKLCNSYNFILKIIDIKKELSTLDVINSDYAEWWMNSADHVNLRCIKKENQYYIASKKKLGVYVILGKIDSKLGRNYKKVWPIIWIFLDKNRKSHILKRLSSINVITYLDYGNSDQISTIKTDVIP